MALGGIACTLGGATMGATALAGSPTSHLTAGLLMTGKILFQFIINFYGFQKKKKNNKIIVFLKFIEEKGKTLQTQHEDGNSIQSLLKIYKRKSLQRKLLNFLSLMIEKKNEKKNRKTEKLLKALLFFYHFFFGKKRNRLQKQ